MPMDVTVDPYLPPLNLCEALEHLFDVIDLRLEFLVWVDPLPIQVDTSDGVPVVAADYTIWVEDWNQDEGIEFPQEFSFFPV